MSSPETLALCAELLHDRRWYLFGAQAAIAHGRVRATNDIDITVLPEGRDPDAALVSRFTAAGFELEDPTLAIGLQLDVGVIQLRRGTDVVDLVLGRSGLEEIFWQRRASATVLGVEVPVLSAADVVVNKILAARAKDIEDAFHVLQANPDIDVEHCRELLGLLEQALDQSDLLPAFERALARSKA